MNHEVNKIICIGEILWDALPSGLYLGGAPLNVCYHLNRFGIDAAMASRVGGDRLGSEAIRQIKMKGIPSELVQTGGEAETGFVCVELDKSGDPTYDIVKPAAWDYIELTPELEQAVESSSRLVFGTLAQRSDVSRTTIQKLWENDAQKIFDMNLRPPYVEKQLVTDSLEVADVVKMNDDEINELKEWYSLPQEDTDSMLELAGRFNISVLCVTSGKKGARLCQDGALFDHPGFPVTTRDAVGAGDAFLAAMLYGLTAGRSGAELLALSNATGALVAQRDGATPDYTLQEITEEMNTG